MPTSRKGWADKSSRRRWASTNCRTRGCRVLAGVAAESVRITKRLLHRDKSEILQVIDEESELFRKRTHSVEAKEAIARFLK